MEPCTPAAAAAPPGKHTSILVLQAVIVLDLAGADVDVMWRKGFREGEEVGRECRGEQLKETIREEAWTDSRVCRAISSFCLKRLIFLLATRLQCSHLKIKTCVPHILSCLGQRRNDYTLLPPPRPLFSPCVRVLSLYFSSSPARPRALTWRRWCSSRVDATACLGCV